MAKNKKIGILIPAISRDTGGLSSALDLSETLYNLNYEVIFFLTEQTPKEYLNLYKTRFPINIKNQNIILAPSGINNLIISGRNLIKILIDFKIYYKNKNYYKYLFHEFIAIFTKVSITSKFIFSNSNFKSTSILSRCDILINIAGLNSIKLNLLRKYYKGILIQNYAGDLINDYKKEVNKNIKFNFYNIELEKYFKYFDYILFQSFDQSDFFNKYFNTLKTKSLTLLPSTDEESILKIVDTPSPFLNNKVNIVLIGTIQERKGQDLALQVLKGLLISNNNFVLHFLGRNVNSRFFKKLNNIIIENNLINNVIFHGHRDDYLLFLANCDIVLQTSLSEGVSRILREAMFLKKPIISFSIPGTNSILINNESALLSKPFDINNMTNDILNLIKDEDLKLKIINNAFKSYLKNHKKEVYKKNIEIIFKNI